MAPDGQDGVRRRLTLPCGDGLERDKFAYQSPFGIGAFQYHDVTCVAAFFKGLSDGSCGFPIRPNGDPLIGASAFSDEADVVAVREVVHDVQALL